jgi:hypothetical protein
MNAPLILPMHLLTCAVDAARRSVVVSRRVDKDKPMAARLLQGYLIERAEGKAKPLAPTAEWQDGPLGERHGGQGSTRRRSEGELAQPEVKV